MFSASLLKAGGVDLQRHLLLVDLVVTVLNILDSKDPGVDLCPPGTASDMSDSVLNEC